LGSIAVEDGQAVSQGDVIGTSGTDKYMPDLGPHLHFELRKDGVAVDPASYFQKGLASLDNIKTTTADVAKENSTDNGSNSNMDRDNSSKTKEGTTSEDESSTSIDQGDQMDDSHS
ncbi:MAG: M23 family metallopeptidase, partial [Tuberibacillus sp.]